MNPVGFFVTPAIILLRKRMKPELSKDTHAGTVPMKSDGKGKGTP
jgi:hypothetical protein